MFLSSYDIQVSIVELASLRTYRGERCFSLEISDATYARFPVGISVRVFGWFSPHGAVGLFRV